MDFLLVQVLQVVEVKSGHVLALELQVDRHWARHVRDSHVAVDGAVLSQVLAHAVDLVLLGAAEEVLGLGRGAQEGQGRDFCQHISIY